MITLKMLYGIPREDVAEWTTFCVHAGLPCERNSLRPMILWLTRLRAVIGLSSMASLVVYNIAFSLDSLRRYYR